MDTLGQALFRDNPRELDKKKGVTTEGWDTKRLQPESRLAPNFLLLFFNKLKLYIYYIAYKYNTLLLI